VAGCGGLRWAEGGWAGLQASGRGGGAEGPLVNFACWAAAKTRLASWFSLFFFSCFPILIKQANQALNSNQGLNPNTQKQCTSMNATVNSYISLIN
jgi:hypothetical protein